MGNLFNIRDAAISISVVIILVYLAANLITITKAQIITEPLPPASQEIVKDNLLNLKEFALLAIGALLKALVDKVNKL